MNKPLSKVPAARRNDVRVRWISHVRPTAAPDVEGTVFMSRGKATWVIWQGDTRPQMVATVGLEVVR